MITTSGAEAGRRIDRPRPAVEITESNAVVYAIDCPQGSSPVWQRLEVVTVIATPGSGELVGSGYATVCRVPVAGTEVEIILACQRKDGVHDGPVASWHADGAIRTRGACRDGLATGRWTRTDADGRLRVEGEFRRGKPVGRWRLWDSAGRRRTLSARTPTNPSLF